MSDDDLAIRFAKAEDADAVIAMARELAAAVADPPPPLDARRFRANALGPERWCDCFIAERQGRAQGYALACRGFEAHTGERRLWLGDLYVRAEARQGGVGRALVRAVARHALALGAAAVYWELWRENAAGAAFYERLRAEAVDELQIMRLGAERLGELARGEDS